MTSLTSTYILALTLLISIVLPTKALAHDLGETYTYLLGGDTCHVVNPASGNAASLRKVDGTIENISDDLTATISCPIPIMYDRAPNTPLSFSGGIEIFFLNSHSSGEQKFRCNAYSFTFLSGGVNRKWNSVDILSDATGSIEFSVSSDFYPTSGVVPRRPTITCGLPPKSALLSILIQGRITVWSPY